MFLFYYTATIIGTPFAINVFLNCSFTWSETLGLGELLAILFVGQYKEEWEMDKEDLKQGIAFSYVYNMDCPDYSEFGSIGFVARFGGLIRTA